MGPFIQKSRSIVPLPNGIRWAIKQGLLKLYREPTNQIRLLPDFIIIGAQKCGTTSLYSYLIQHPCVASAYKKEINFFNINFNKGMAWYRSHFPSTIYKRYIKHTFGRDFITGEGSPDYLNHPYAPKRIFDMIPQVKIIIMLRNPVDRAYSNYHMRVRKRRENLTFQDAINREIENIGNNRSRPGDENYPPYKGYLSRGIYINQLKAWMDLFSKEQITILQSEIFFDNPPKIFTHVSKFLDLPNWELKNYEVLNSGNYSGMNPSTRKYLIEFFKPYNQELYESLGMDFNWEK